MSSIRYAIEGNLCVIKLSGAIRHLQAPSFDALVQHICSDSGPRKFLIDLTTTEYMDSTILGVLAGVARWASAKELEQPVLAGPSADVATVLTSMGFDHYFAIDNASEPRGDEGLKAAPPGNGSDTVKTRLLLDAHKTLMAMNAKNHDEFHDAVELLAQGDNAH